MTAITKARANYPIGALSRLTGVNIETIRYYERIGMVPAPPRSESGRRIYGEDERRVLAFIRRGRELGFSLPEIRALLELGAPGDASCGEVREIASAHLAGVRREAGAGASLAHAADVMEIAGCTAMLWMWLPQIHWTRSRKTSDRPNVSRT